MMHPFLKRTSLDLDGFNNYHPVANSGGTLEDTLTSSDHMVLPARSARIHTGQSTFLEEYLVFTVELGALEVY